MRSRDRPRTRSSGGNATRPSARRWRRSAARTGRSWSWLRSGYRPEEIAGIIGKIEPGDENPAVPGAEPAPVSTRGRRRRVVTQGRRRHGGGAEARASAPSGRLSSPGRGCPSRPGVHRADGGARPARWGLCAGRRRRDADDDRGRRGRDRQDASVRAFADRVESMGVPGPDRGMPAARDGRPAVCAHSSRPSVTCSASRSGCVAGAARSQPRRARPADARVCGYPARPTDGGDPGSDRVRLAGRQRRPIRAGAPVRARPRV